MIAKQQVILESDLAQRLGLPRDEVKRWREKMEVGTDWIQSKPVTWTKPGVLKLEEQLGLDKAVVVEERPKVEVEEGKQSAQVVRCHFKNRRMIEARLSSGAVSMVLVRDAGLYLAGQLFEVRKNGEGWMESKKPKKKGVF